MINSEKAGYDIQWELAVPIAPIFSLRAISVGNVYCKPTIAQPQSGQV